MHPSAYLPATFLNLCQTHTPGKIVEHIAVNLQRECYRQRYPLSCWRAFNIQPEKGSAMAHIQYTTHALHRRENTTFSACFLCRKNMKKKKQVEQWQQTSTLQSPRYPRYTLGVTLQPETQIDTWGVEAHFQPQLMLRSPRTLSQLTTRRCLGVSHNALSLRDEGPLVSVEREGRNYNNARELHVLNINSWERIHTHATGWTKKKKTEIDPCESSKGRRQTPMSLRSTQSLRKSCAHLVSELGRPSARDRLPRRNARNYNPPIRSSQPGPRARGSVSDDIAR